MTHPLVTIEETATVQPQKIQTTHVGGINYGAALVEMFADENGEATKVKQLQAMAQVITYEEFSKAVKHAKDIADATDKANGFVKAEGAKGQDAYGPKRQLLNARMSEAKRVFGVAKMAPDVLKEKGYWAAVNTAREWLEANGKTWDGQTAESAESKQARKHDALRTGAIAKAMNENPQQKDEDRATWLQRIDAIMNGNIAAMEAEVFEKRVQTIEASLRKQFGTDFNALCEACTRILSTTVAEEAPM